MKKVQKCWNTLHGRNPIYIYICMHILHCSRFMKEQLGDSPPTSKLPSYCTMAIPVCRHLRMMIQVIPLSVRNLHHWSISNSTHKNIPGTVVAASKLLYLHQPGTAAVWSLSTRLFPQTLSKRTEEKHVRWDGFSDDIITNDWPTR